MVFSKMLIQYKSSGDLFWNTGANHSPAIAFMIASDCVHEAILKSAIDNVVISQLIDHALKELDLGDAVVRNGGLGHVFQVGKKSIYIFGNNQKWKNQNPSHRSIMEVMVATKKERERASREVFLVQRNQLLAQILPVIALLHCLSRFFSAPVMDAITMVETIHKALASVKINVPCNYQLLDHFPEFRVGVLSGFLGGRHKLLKKLQEVLDCWNL